MDKKQLVISILVFIAAILSIVSYLFLGGKEYLDSNKSFYPSEVSGKWYVVKGFQNGNELSLEEIFGSKYNENDVPYIYLFADKTAKSVIDYDEEESRGNFEIKKNIVYVTINSDTRTMNYDSNENIMYYNYTDELTLVLERK